MSDVMLFGVLKMPYEMAMRDEISRIQFYQRVQELVAKVETQPEQGPVAAQEKSCRTCSHRNPSLEVQGNQGACGGCRFYSHYNCATPPAAQQQAEPVAEVKVKMTGGNVGIATIIHEIYDPFRERLQAGDKLYTATPAAQRPWVGLTDEEMSDAVADMEVDFGDLLWKVVCLTKLIEAKLKERNGY